MTGHLYIALVHHPVKNAQGETITTAITNVDLHDLARLGRTYGCGDVFIVTPITLQQELAGTIRGHWVGGSGGRRIPDRAEAIRLLNVQPSLEAVHTLLSGRHSRRPTVVVTGAQLGDVSVPPSTVRQRLEQGEVVLLLFGTGWGLAEAIIDGADLALQPIRGIRDEYNHISVRSAVAIMLDRATAGWAPDKIS